MRLDTLQKPLGQMSLGEQVPLIRGIRSNRLVNKRAKSKLKSFIREAQALDEQEKRALSALLAGAKN